MAMGGPGLREVWLPRYALVWRAMRNGGWKWLSHRYLKEVGLWMGGVKLSYHCLCRGGTPVELLGFGIIHENYLAD